MSGSPQVPRLLAALLGVEVTPPPGWAAQQQPPAGPPVTVAPVADPAGVTSERIGRRPAERGPRTGGESAVGAEAARTSRHAAASAASVARSDRTVPALAVREAVATPGALRVGIVLAEVLGAPRALRPYRPEGPLAR